MVCELLELFLKCIYLESNVCVCMLHRYYLYVLTDMFKNTFSHSRVRHPTPVMESRCIRSVQSCHLPTNTFPGTHVAYEQPKQLPLLSG